MSVAVVLFTADLRVRDQPALSAAVREADEVVPLFVVDRGVHRAGFDVPNRRAFLADCLASLDAGLRERGGRLVIRTGEVTEQVCRVVSETGARAVHIAAGASGYARRREARLRMALGSLRCALQVHEGVIHVLPPGEVRPEGSNHFAVFAPYFDRWAQTAVRDEVAAPPVVSVPELAGHPLPRRTAVTDASPRVAGGGESEGRRRLTAWLAADDPDIEPYEERHDDLSADATSRLSPHLHFGTLSPAELVRRARHKGGPAADTFARRLAWRDFHHQVLAARPDASHTDYRRRGDHWRGNEKEITAWKEGRTGCPIVDAGMRQLLHEGWMPHRARLLTASYLTKTLYTDWRVGARHFLDLLVDGDVAACQLNWQAVAGTGTDTRPNRVLDPLSQARRFDPRGDYVRRWVPELAALEGAEVHRPWALDDLERARLDYPDPLVDPDEGRARFARARGAA